MFLQDQQLIATLPVALVMLSFVAPVTVSLSQGLQPCSCTERCGQSDQGMLQSPSRAQIEFNVTRKCRSKDYYKICVFFYLSTVWFWNWKQDFLMNTNAFLLLRTSSWPTYFIWPSIQTHSVSPTLPVKLSQCSITTSPELFNGDPGAPITFSLTILKLDQFITCLLNISIQCIHILQVPLR